MPEEDRDEIFVMLGKYVKEGTPLLLTSRPVDVLLEKTKKQFQQFHIEPFSIDQQRQLIKNWFADKADDFQKAFARPRSRAVETAPPELLRAQRRSFRGVPTRKRARRLFRTDELLQ